LIEPASRNISAGHLQVYSLFEISPALLPRDRIRGGAAFKSHPDSQGKSQDYPISLTLIPIQWAKRGERSPLTRLMLTQRQHLSFCRLINEPSTNLDLQPLPSLSLSKPDRPLYLYLSFIALLTSLSASRLFNASLLSYVFFPLASPRETFAFPFLKYISNGTNVKPLC